MSNTEKCRKVFLLENNDDNGKLRKETETNGVKVTSDRCYLSTFKKKLAFFQQTQVVYNNNNLPALYAIKQTRKCRLAMKTDETRQKRPFWFRLHADQSLANA